MADTDQTERRHSGSQKRQRSALIPTRVTPAEKAEVEDAASRYGVTVGTFARTAMLGVARGEKSLGGLPVRSVRRPPVERELLARCLGQLGKVGSNLNQVAKATHTGRAGQVELNEVVTSVREAVVAIMEAMGRKP